MIRRIKRINGIRRLEFRIRIRKTRDRKRKRDGV